MELTLAVLADAANRSDSGKLNILGIFTSIFAPHVPCQHPQMTLVLSFQASPMERGTQQVVAIRLVNADGQTVLAPPDSTLTVPSEGTELSPGLNLMASFNGVTFSEFGAYQFDILVNGEMKAHLPISVIQTR